MKRRSSRMVIRLTTAAIWLRLSLVVFVCGSSGIIVVRSADAAAVSFTNVLDTTMTTPSGAQVINVSVPSNDNGTLAFHTGAADGAGGAVVCIAPLGGPLAFVSPPSVSPLLSAGVAVSGNTTAFRASGGVANRIYTSDGGPPSRHIGFGDAAPTGTFSSLTDPAFAGSTLAFVGEFGNSGSGSVGIFTQTLAGARTTVAKTGDPAPGGFGTFGDRFAGSSAGVTPPDTDGQRVVFGAGAPLPAFTTFGVFTGSVTGGDLDLVVKTGDPAPVGVFNEFGGLSISGSEVGLIGIYNGADSGVFTRDGAGPLVVRAKRGDPAPVGTFRTLGAISVGGDGTAVFGATYTDSLAGLFFSDGVSPTPVPILLPGDSLFGSTLNEAVMSPNAYDASNGGTLAFHYRLTDGRSGVALATLPEPGCGAVLALLGVGIASRGRSREKSLKS